MVSSFYSEAGYRTGVTHGVKFAREREKCVKFDFKVLKTIPHRVYRVRLGNLKRLKKNKSIKASSGRKLGHLEDRSVNFFEIENFRKNRNFFIGNCMKNEHFLDRKKKLSR